MPPNLRRMLRAAQRLAGREKLPTVVRSVVAAESVQKTAERFSEYFNQPEKFIREVLDVKVLTPEQVVILSALPGRVKIESGHNTGKSFIMAAVVLWWMYTRDPGVVICNAPSKRAVEDVLWIEVRLLWHRAKQKYPNLPDYFVGPKAAEMYHSPDHWAKGYTTSTGESFQGRHRDRMLFIFDEDEGIDPIYWTTTSTMYQPDGGHCWIASCNPVTTSTQSFLESTKLNLDGTPKWNLFRLSSLNHPNIVEGLAGKKPSIPNAVTVGQVEEWVANWTTPVSAYDDRQPHDVEWPPGKGKFYRPGPLFKSRVLGLRPTEAIDTVWSLAAFDTACESKWDHHDCWRRRFGVSIGLDCAFFGDDDSAFHVRSGPLSLHHETRQGWGPDKLAGRLKQLCREWSGWYNSLAVMERQPLAPEDVRVVVETDGGAGVGVLSHGYVDFPKWSGVAVGGGSDKLDSNGNELYCNLRAEVWFESCRKAAAGLMDLSRLPVEVRNKLRVQLLSPTYQVRPDGTRQVESKKDIKKRLGRSPDDADALILSHYDAPDRSPSIIRGREAD